MEAWAIALIASTHRHLRDYFKGVFAADTIPLITSFPSAIVVNTDLSEAGGKHWIGLYVVGKRELLEVFDSAGANVESYPDPFLQNDIVCYPYGFVESFHPYQPN